MLQENNFIKKLEKYVDGKMKTFSFWLKSGDFELPPRISKRNYFSILLQHVRLIKKTSFAMRIHLSYDLKWMYATCIVSG